MTPDLELRDMGEDVGHWDLVPFLEAPLRRPWLLIIPLVLVTAVAGGLGLTLPKRYRTSTLILVESQKVPDAVLREDPDARGPKLQTIRQEILSRTRLERVLQDTNPYPELKEHASLTSIVEMMRDSIEISVKGNDAFSIEYTHHDPKKAQEVTNRLAALFIEETSQSREEEATGAAEFLESQLEEARKELEAKDLAIRRYKEARMGRLPEQTSANLATLQRLQLEQQSVAEGLRAARQRELDLVSGGDTARLPGDGRGSSTVLDPAVELSQLRAQLATLRTRYTDEHPDVRNLRERITRLEKQIADAPQELPGADAARPLRQAQLEQVRREVASLETKQRDLEERTSQFQARVEDTPRTEQELATLTRDYQKLNENYLELLKKRMAAQMTQRLERRWKGEQFRVLDPAYLPEEAVFPRRSLFLTGGLFVGLILGVSLTLVAEFLDSTVKSLQQLEMAMPFPVLATFPRLGAKPGLVSRTLRLLLDRGVRPRRIEGVLRRP